MSHKTFDFLVFIGRFQPLHNGHLAVIQQGLAQSERLIVLLGSAWQPRTVRNPWTVAEREQMLRGCLGEADNARTLVAPLMDAPYSDELWVRNVQATVHGLVTAHHGAPHRTPRIGLIGHAKDHSSYYLKLFPQWASVAVENVGGLSATPLREAVFGLGEEGDGRQWLQASGAAVLPAGVCDWLEQFAGTTEYAEVRDEHRFINEYRSGWEQAPYEPTFVTVDAVVVQSGLSCWWSARRDQGAGCWPCPAVLWVAGKDWWTPACGSCARKPD